MDSRGCAAVAIACALAAVTISLRAAAFDTKTASFALAYHGVVSGYRDAAMFVLPGERLPIEAVAGPAGDYTLTTDAGIAEPLGVRTWRWTAPERPGVYALKIAGPGAKHDTVTLRALVMVPATEMKDGWLRGYRVGEYPAPVKSNRVYLPPRGFMEVTKENGSTKLSPHFELKQFVCKEDPPDRFPKFVVVNEKLPLALEAILEEVNTKLGVSVDTLHVMSGYRTPFYNRAIGDVKYSMHQFGSAADIYVDPERRDRMADLNHDHRVDINDSKLLYDRIEELLAPKAFRRFQGGMGFYPATDAHPPFVHVDVRGARARWRG